MDNQEIILVDDYVQDYVIYFSTQRSSAVAVAVAVEGVELVE